MKKNHSFSRSLKIADKIHKEVASILRNKVRDPRLNWVTISEVEVTTDNVFAKIYWTTVDNSKLESISQALAAATTFIRSELSHTFETYTIPQLKFVYDESLERGAKILQLLNEADNNNSESS